ncbi:MAG TPA: hypothetical protein VF645_12645 [Allosphingosinicella sp.]|jgi:predicted transcriptional regulator
MDDCPRLDSGDENDGAAAQSASNQAHLLELRAAVQRGLDDIKAGRVADVEEAFGRIEAMLDELEAAKRA